MSLIEFDVGGRASGKTYRIIQILADHPERVMVVPDIGTARRLRSMYGDGKRIRDQQIVTMEDLRRGRIHDATEVCFDNVEAILSMLAPARTTVIHAAGHGIYSDAAIDAQRDEVENRMRTLYDGKWEPVDG